MRVSYNWLKQYVDVSQVTPQELASKLTVAGLEVEAIETLATGTNLVVGHVLTCEMHPDSDHLHVTTVDVKDEVLNIVCGAPNVEAGQKVIVSKIGAVLAGGFEIKPAKVRGVDSQGMICSLSELGVDKKQQTQEQLDGIYVFEDEVEVGATNVLELLGLDDVILDIGLTPNRADCNAMWNVAKEVAALLRTTATWPTCTGASEIGTKSNFVVNSTSEKCPYFLGKVVNHIKVGPSPKWLVHALQAYGVKSINNVVDISNYVMIETGQPLHFYDLNKLAKQEITVVDNQEVTLTALDGIEYQIQTGDLLITTNGVATGIAGVMGGDESKIDESTTGIFIEAAAFDSASIRNTARRVSLHTEAAARFMKGLEPLSQKKAVDRSVQLLIELAQADGFEENVEFGSINYTPKVVSETITHLNTLLGTDFTMSQVTEVLSALEFNPQVDGDTFHCTVPSYRTDISIREDIDEEVIRMLGFDDLPTTLPLMEATVGSLTPRQNTRRKVRELLSGLGLSEVLTYTLVSDDNIANAVMPMGQPVSLASPMSEERKHVRTSLSGSLLECLAHNQNHKNTNFNAFEISMVYAQGLQQERFAYVLSQSLQSNRLQGLDVKTDFYTAKGALMIVLENLGFASERISFEVNTVDTNTFHPYRSAVVKLGNQVLGIIGDVHPTVVKKWGVTPAVIAEINLDLLVDSKPSKVKFTSINRFPAVRRDIALVVDENLEAAKLLKVIKTNGKRLVTDIEVFDVYQGEHVQAGTKSVAITITYQSADHTLTEQEINEVHQQVLNKLEKETNAILRA